MKLPATLLLTYQAEYETTPNYTIDDLCQKYAVTTKQLSGYTKWTKRLTEPSEPNKLPEPSVIPSNTIVTKEPVNVEELLEDVDEFKKLAVAHAVKFMKNDVEFAEVKEFKDMVAIVDSIEKSYKDSKDTGTTINVLVQNLQQRFRETPDDC